jgi:hypothetical protein
MRKTPRKRSGRRKKLPTGAGSERSSNSAMETMKAKIGGKYNSIEWNEGGKPEINKDEALGLTATFENAVALDSDVKYSVNFVQYVRQGSDKFLLLFSQQPLKALEKHGDAMAEIIKSIKVKNP